MAELGCTYTPNAFDPVPEADCRLPTHRATDGLRSPPPCARRPPLGASGDPTRLAHPAVPAPTWGVGITAGRRIPRPPVILTPQHEGVVGAPTRGGG